MTFDQFFRILRARWLLALSVMGALVAITMGICLVMPKSYKATASVMVDLKPDPVAGMSGMVGLQSAGLMATQIDIITSPALATRVARQIGMDPAELRRKNFVGKDQFPFATATGLNYASK